MACEVIYFIDLFDRVATIAADTGKVYSNYVPVLIVSDSSSLLNNISKGSRKSEKRVMHGIAAAREGIKDKVIFDIGFMRRSRNLADSFTKAMSKATLRDVVCTRFLKVFPKKYIIRK